LKPLSISIPTFNRPKLLNELLDNLCDQAMVRDVDINIFDNSNNDDTEKLIKKFSKYSNIKYFKNEKNIGYVNNQIKCFDKSESMYTAFLCDDDIYIDNSIQTILNVIHSESHFSFIALNYYSFNENHLVKKNTKFAPIKDVFFKRAYDILNFPSVGHFSGFIFNTKLVQEELNSLKKQYNSNLSIEFEKYRGIITHLANLILSKTDLPSYFIGEQILAAREPYEVDYDLLNHLNYDNISYYKSLFENGIINLNDYNYKKKLVLSSLPKAIMIESTKKNNNEYDLLRKKFDNVLGDEFKYRFLIRPLFRISQLNFIKFFWKFFYKYYKIYF
jgi:glycosyltransferase involved in cell wall biosynthesis